MPAGVQSVEIGDAIDTQHNDLSIEHELPDAVLQGGCGDPRIALRPIIAAPRNQAHSITVPLDADAEAVMFDFVKPLWSCRDLGCIGRQAELKRLKHARKIGIRSGFAKA